MAHISDIKLIRTDTTLDLSQKAEKDCCMEERVYQLLHNSCFGFDVIAKVTIDLACIKNTRMDRCAFHALCNMLKGIEKLEPSRNMGAKVMVAMFLHTIAHDVKIRIIKRQFMISAKTINRRFNDILLAILKYHNFLLKKPQPFSQDRIDER
ncbi:hypothetical protein HN51_002983 [Arachis hypogaea]